MQLSNNCQLFHKNGAPRAILDNWYCFIAVDFNSSEDKVKVVL